MINRMSLWKWFYFVFFLTGFCFRVYLQRKIAFDQDYGFEYTLLEPKDFWRRVPPKVRSVYHFFNAPVSKGHNETDLSPVEMILDIAKPEDFVAFKLDIDSPTVRIFL
jgi:hypothetical protein